MAALVPTPSRIRVPVRARLAHRKPVLAPTSTPAALRPAAAGPADASDSPVPRDENSPASPESGAGRARADDCSPSGRGKEGADGCATFGSGGEDFSRERGSPSFGGAAPPNADGASTAADDPHSASGGPSAGTASGSPILRLSVADAIRGTDRETASDSQIGPMEAAARDAEELRPSSPASGSVLSLDEPSSPPRPQEVDGEENRSVADRLVNRDEAGFCPDVVDGDENRGVADRLVEQDGSSAVSCEDGERDLLSREDLPAEDGEMEEGQLPGEWSGALEECQDDSEPEDDSGPAQVCDDSGDLSSGSGRDPEASKGSADGPICWISGNGPRNAGPRSSGNGNVNGKKARKHRKGKGSKKRSREKSSKDKHGAVIKKRRLDGTRVDDSANAPGGRKNVDSVPFGERGRLGSGIAQSKKGPAKPASSALPTKSVVDEGPEDGEILLESTKTDNGILCSMVEAEVGLWTTDDIDDQLVAEMEEETGKKKRGPETAERKLKRKIAKRKKRAQKERELGIRRPPRRVQTQPVKVLCTHFMKGRCAKGDQCTFSHDAIPLTKQEPCKFLMSHSCLKGDDCPYSHDLGAFPCKFFHTRGLCYDGANCQFSHEAISEEAMEKLQKRVEKEKKDRSNAPAVDIPTPMFSTSLPMDLDPDPLGWGTTTSHPAQGLRPEIQASLTFKGGDHDVAQYHRLSPPLNIISRPLSASTSSVTENTQADRDGSVLPRTEEEEESGKFVSLKGRSADQGVGSLAKDVCKDEAESFASPSSASFALPFSLSGNRMWNSTVLQPPSGEGSSVKNGLEASIEATEMERPHEKDPNFDQKMAGGFGFDSKVNGMRSAAPVVPPLLVRGRQPSGTLDNTVISTRRSTVDSLLGAALGM